jgi:cell division protein FtsB
VDLLDFHLHLRISRRIRGSQICNEQDAEKYARLRLTSMLPSRSSQRWAVYLFSSLLVALSLFTAFGERGVFHLWRLWDEKKHLAEKNFLLQRENETLRERASRILHDDRYLEKIAREELGLIKPGEMVYRFAAPDSKRNKSSGPVEVPAASSEKVPPS